MTDDDPGAGDPGQLRSLARNRDAVLRATSAAVRAVRSATEFDHTAWAGSAADAFAATVPSVLASALVLEAGLQFHETALARYADGVAAIQEEQREALRQLAEAEATIGSERTWLLDLDDQFHRVTALGGGEPGDLAGLRQQRARAEDTAALAERERADVESALEDLRVRRRRLDGAFVEALHDADDANAVLRRAGVAASATDLVALLAAMTPEQVRSYADAHRALVRAAFSGSADAVRHRWDSMGASDGTTAVQSALLAALPSFFGSLDGVPVEARVAANRHVAVRRIRRLDHERAALVARGRRGEGDLRQRIAQLDAERAYLALVAAGRRRTYLLDIDHSRIIEVLGTPSPATRHVITYVPGTFTNLDAMYGGGVRQVPAYLSRRHQEDAVVFVYKDGRFPGVVEPDGTTTAKGFVIEANDTAFALRSGRQLASFTRGVESDPVFAAARSTAIGHSWGLANVAASEVAGSRYDAVVSLSGAGMPLDWRADPATEYFDYSYNDVLQVLQAPVLDAVWQGVNPRHEPAFEHGPYYRSPADDAADRTPGLAARVEAELGALTSNHSLVASNAPANRPLLQDLDRQVLR
ncbi:hypothetical protein DEI93_04850 [Curtobacterium sp. MCBD17_035]|uniref:hypothetical protein n=1 Tax=Curtobacterium sp. MCBD17_035 TaxID=2175673 RepID=UPI000DA802BC|nr:hypothetical protein [Curtobacterium sp. MCBD17_035]WIB68368.1 hypothetical protein DEI93_04850 [Curtobacterium sp. MCBD17_035]